MRQRQNEIITALKVTAPFLTEADVAKAIDGRIEFIKQVLRDSHLKVLVLGISGGVDSTLTGRLAQLAVEQLRGETGDSQYRFLAVRLPYLQQQDELDAQLALKFIAPDEVVVINIAAGVVGLAEQLPSLATQTPEQKDFVRGNIKARMRMVAQFALANTYAGLVVGTDHAAESLTGFFTKFGDGACDLAPLTGLVKGQVRALAAHLGAPDSLVYKVPTADLEELDPSKPDEKSYGVSYDEIDAFLHGQEVSQATYERLVYLYDISQHKREMPKAPL